MFFKRTLLAKITEKLKNSNKIVILYGARQTGKTTLANEIFKNINSKILKINADEKKYIDILSSRDFNKLDQLTSGYDYLFIDEAQRIPDIGINLKILHDRKRQLKILATGSSSFDLANKIREPLTGRTWTYNLFPISISELSFHFNDFELNDRLESILIYGLYPELLNYRSTDDRIKYLKELTTSYLYRDIIEIKTIKHSQKIHDLLRLIAFQIGSEVSCQELGKNLGMSKDTVNTYIDLLEKSFVIFRLSGFNRNLRKEVTKMNKIYFYDPGIRNTIIDNMKPLNLRNDAGQLWENFLIIERLKHLSCFPDNPRKFFWRTYTGAELDYIEERSENLRGFEIKYGKKKVKAPKSWLETYPGATFECINSENYLKFVK